MHIETGARTTRFDLYSIDRYPPKQLNSMDNDGGRGGTRHREVVKESCAPVQRPFALSDAFFKGGGKPSSM